MKWIKIVCAFLTVFSVSCNHYQFSNYQAENSKVADSQTIDSSLYKIIKPYKDELSKKMDVIIGSLQTDLSKAKPESSLGNFICDALLVSSSDLFSTKIDFVVYNYGGIRLSSLSAGPITKGKIFELLPFENFATMVTLDGNTTIQLIQKICDEGGWPVSGISFIIKNGKPESILINNQPIQLDKTYHILMNDYMANGGDHLDFLPGNKIEFSGKTIRDVILQYIEKQNSSGIAIQSFTDNRIKYAE